MIKKNKNTNSGPIDFTFFLIVMGLLCFGLIMVFSASSEAARNDYNDAYFFIKKQFIWAVISIVVMFLVANFDYHKLGKLAPIILIGTVFLLVLVLLIGTEAKGGKRWINLGFASIQPSEFAKVAVIIFFSYSLSKNQGILEKFVSGLLPYLGVLGFLAGLIMLEPHFSGTVVTVGVGIIILFLAGAKMWHLGLLAAPVGLVGALVIAFSDYRRARVLSFLDPFQDPQGSGWQVIQSLYAIGSGGFFGLGLGRSRQKFLYIPEPHNDFIFAILCEEFGFIGATLTIFAFIALIWRGIKISMEAPDTFGSLLAAGITSLIAIEVIINIAVVTSSMPVTGMALPFFSYGGTALVVIMACMGIMLNISRQSKKKVK